MPGEMDGIELAKTAAGIRPEIAILITSGYNDGARRSDFSAERIDLLSKPYRKSELARAVKRGLTRSIRDRKASG